MCIRYAFLLLTAIVTVTAGLVSPRPAIAATNPLAFISISVRVAQFEKDVCSHNADAKGHAVTTWQSEPKPMTALQRMVQEQTSAIQSTVRPALSAHEKFVSLNAQNARQCLARSAAVPQLSISDNFLASKRFRIGSTKLDANWRRVQREKIHDLNDVHIFGNLTQEQKIFAVNIWVNRTITYVRDRDLFGRSDHWAGARQTLLLRRGDCEDIALVKMEMLAEAGFSREDMFLSIVRDRVKRMDHAVLAVRTSAGFVILDNATDRVLRGDLAHDYTPIMSFNSASSWIHAI